MKERKTRLRLRLNTEAWEEFAASLELTSDADRARWLGVPEPTYHRITQWKSHPADSFIAHLMDRIQPYEISLTSLLVTQAESGLGEEEVPDLLKRPEAAAYLRIGCTRLDELRRTGELKSVRVGGQVRIRRVDLEAYLKNLQPA